MSAWRSVDDLRARVTRIEALTVELTAFVEEMWGSDAPKAERAMLATARRLAKSAREALADAEHNLAGKTVGKVSTTPIRPHLQGEG